MTSHTFVRRARRSTKSIVAAVVLTAAALAAFALATRDQRVADTAVEIVAPVLGLTGASAPDSSISDVGTAVARDTQSAVR